MPPNGIQHNMPPNGVHNLNMRPDGSSLRILSRRYEKTHATYCPFRPKNLKTYCCNMFGWFGEVGGTRNNHTHRCLWSLNYLAKRKVRKTTKIIFRVFNTSNSSPILLFCPINPKSCLFFKYKKTRTGNLIEIRAIKSWFGAKRCHLVSIRMPVFEPKNLEFE